MIAITGMGLAGVLRLTWVHDNLAHVLDDSQANETSRTWTGLACSGPRPDRGRRRRQRWCCGAWPPGASSPNPLRKLRASSPPNTLGCSRPLSAYPADDPERAEQLWEDFRAIWSHTRSANHVVPEFRHGTGLTRFAPGRTLACSHSAASASRTVRIGQPSTLRRARRPEGGRRL